MKNEYLYDLIKRKIRITAIMIAAAAFVIYLLISLYFVNHFYFNTVVNGVNLSLKAHEDAEKLIRSHLDGYRLQLLGRYGETEEIAGRSIDMRYNADNGISKIYSMQNPLLWPSPLFSNQRYTVEDLIIYSEAGFIATVDGLDCVNKGVIQPGNVNFYYSNGAYELVKEIYGNKIIKKKLMEAVRASLLNGETALDLDENECYENPEFTVNSPKTSQTLNLLNRYVSAKVTYVFGNETVLLDGNTIKDWLGVDKNLEVTVNMPEVAKFVRGLGKKYDTVGITRNFKTSTGRRIEIKGGLYGWKINQNAEGQALLENIRQGQAVEREPAYIQRALARGEGEIGGTYVEINITRQHLWLYKDGRIISQGPVVTGNLSRNHGTVTGTYMLNYKQKGANLTGPGYEAGVTYWMPFFGGIGIHDASWRHAFGGDIYKTNGSHGCVNAPLYLAKRVYETIESGTPIICYEEETDKNKKSD